MWLTKRNLHSVLSQVKNSLSAFGLGLFVVEVKLRLAVTGAGGSHEQENSHWKSAESFSFCASGSFLDSDANVLQPYCVLCPPHLLDSQEEDRALPGWRVE